MAGLRYEVHKMPQGMQEKVVAKVLEKISSGTGGSEAVPAGEEETPCETCRRWSECNGVAWGQECPYSQRE